MHIWLNKSLIKNSNLYSKKHFFDTKCKGQTGDVVASEVKDFKYNKLLVLDKLPKESRALGKTRD